MQPTNSKAFILKGNTLHFQFQFHYCLAFYSLWVIADFRRLHEQNNKQSTKRNFSIWAKPISTQMSMLDNMSAGQSPIIFELDLIFISAAHT